MKINMPEGAKFIIKKLTENGYEAYIVGGCVRDSILGKQPMDWDITTSAKPLEVKEIFKRTVDTGIQHGTVTVLYGKEGYEVTTYRVDGEYKDHRRPEEVIFTASLLEDMKRRDFTINAMAYNDEQGIIDEFDGQGDLERGVIRCVGNPTERFDEDALRILRAVRFAAQLHFQIDEATKAAIRNQARFLADISAERIRVELTKMITSEHPEELIEASELGITKVVLPEFDTMLATSQNNPHHCYDVGRHSIVVMRNVDATPVLRWAALLHDMAKPQCKTVGEDGIDHFYNHPKVGGPMARDLLRRLKFDNDTISRVQRLVEWHDYGLGCYMKINTFRKGLNDMGPDLFEDFCKIRYADMMGQSDYHREDKIKNYQHILKLHQEIMEQQQCVTMKQLAVNGKDLISIGVKPGPDMGAILKDLLNEVLEEPELNTKEQLLELAKQIIANKEH